MSFLNKIKLNYNIKLLDDHIANHNNAEIYNLLKNTKSSKSEYFFTLLNRLNHKYSNLQMEKTYFQISIQFYRLFITMIKNLFLIF